MSEKVKKESWFKGRISNILFGIFCILVSLDIRSGDEEFYYHWGARVSRLTWILWFVLGAAFLIFGLMKKVKTAERFDYTLICTNCFKTNKPRVSKF